MVSWMEGFRRCYELPKSWGLVKERLIAFSLVILAGIPLTFSTVLVAFGNRIETRILFQLGHEFGPFILLMWTAIRWLIAGLTSIAVISLIYHNAVPRTQPWHSVLPGATLASALWFAGDHAVWLVPAALRRLQHPLRLAGRGYRPAGVDVHDFAGGSGGSGVQRHALPAGPAGNRADRDQRAPETARVGASVPLVLGLHVEHSKLCARAASVAQRVQVNAAD